jgi:hypothetical protein
MIRTTMVPSIDTHEDNNLVAFLRYNCEPIFLRPRQARRALTSAEAVKVACDKYARGANCKACQAAFRPRTCSPDRCLSSPVTHLPTWRVRSF